MPDAASSPGPTTPNPGETLPTRTRRGAARGVLMALGVALVAGAAWYYVSTLHEESTDDAFTDGRAATIAPKIAGYVSELAVDDNQFVKAGQLLLVIDPRDYVVARDRAGSALKLAEAQLASAEVNAAMARTSYPADLASARAQRDSAAAGLVRAEADFNRQRTIDKRATTQADIDAATASRSAAKATLADTEAKLKKAGLVAENIAAADAQVSQYEGQVAQARADLAQAELNLSHTQIIASQDGWVTKRNVEIGAYVQAGQSLMAVVSPDVWVTANFKESQLRDMRPGQTVHIDVDAYPQLHLTGKVDSIQMGSGSRFSSFPAENATGNFIKIVQRIPVKIVINGGIDPKIPLPLGLSVLPTVEEK